jgi:hypothetical protein
MYLLHKLETIVTDDHVCSVVYSCERQQTMFELLCDDQSTCITCTLVRHAASDGVVSSVSLAHNQSCLALYANREE